jgi:hypothetical protein
MKGETQSGGLGPLKNGICLLRFDKFLGPSKNLTVLWGDGAIVGDWRSGIWLDAWDHVQVNPCRLLAIFQALISARYLTLAAL